MQGRPDVGINADDFRRKLARRVSFLLFVAAGTGVVQIVTVLREPQDWIIVPAAWMGSLGVQRLLHVGFRAGPIVWAALCAVLGLELDAFILRLLRKAKHRSDQLSFVALWLLIWLGGPILISRIFPGRWPTTFLNEFPYSVAPLAAALAFGTHMILAIAADRKRTESARSFALIFSGALTCAAALFITTYWIPDPLSSLRLAWITLMALLIVGMSLAMALLRLDLQRLERIFQSLQRWFDVAFFRPFTPVLLTAAVLVTTLISGTRPFRSGTGDGQARPNIILITVDTLRADHLGCYGYHLPTTPNLDRFAEEATVFTRCISTAPNTVPAMVSMMTSQYPSYNSVGTESMVAMRFDEPTLARVLAENEYRTAGFVSNMRLDRKLHLYEGFDIYDVTATAVEHSRDLPVEHSGDSPFEYQPTRTADSITKYALNRLATAPDNSFFLWVHYIDPHGPYCPPERYLDGFPENAYPGGPKRLSIADHEGRGGIPLNLYVKGQRSRAYYVSRYDAEIAYTDDCIGRLLNRIKELGLWEKSIVIFTADHGEAMGEHNVYFNHVVDVTEELIHVPLIVHIPGEGQIEKVDELVSIIDIAPTILAAAGIDERLGTGLNLMPLIRGNHERVDREHVVAEDPQGRISFRSRGMKFIAGPDGERLYDLDRDPDELKNLLEEKPDLAVAWQAILDGYRDGADPCRGSPVRYDSDDMEKLKALGYVN